MNDFLDRLAAKAIGGEAALLPRLPSLFEPTSPRSAALPMNNSDDASATMAEPAPAVGMLSMDRQKPSSNETAANAPGVHPPVRHRVWLPTRHPSGH